MDRQASTRCKVIFVLYLLALTAIILLKFDIKSFSFSLSTVPDGYPNNFVLGKSIALFVGLLSNGWNFYAFANLFGNILIFIPYGLLFPQVFRCTLHLTLTLLSGILLSVVYETIQYFTRWGVCDVDDVFLNGLGVFIGLLIFILLRACGRLRGVPKVPREE